MQARSIKIVQTCIETGRERVADLCWSSLVMISDRTRGRKSPSEILDAMLWGDKTRRRDSRTTSIADTLYRVRISQNRTKTSAWSRRPRPHCSLKAYLAAAIHAPPAVIPQSVTADRSCRDSMVTF